MATNKSPKEREESVNVPMAHGKHATPWDVTLALASKFVSLSMAKPKKKSVKSSPKPSPPWTMAHIKHPTN